MEPAKKCFVCFRPGLVATGDRVGDQAVLRCQCGRIQHFAFYCSLPGCDAPLHTTTFKGGSNPNELLPKVKEGIFCCDEHAQQTVEIHIESLPLKEPLTVKAQDRMVDVLNAIVLVAKKHNLWNDRSQISIAQGAEGEMGPCALPGNPLMSNVCPFAFDKKVPAQVRIVCPPPPVAQSTNRKAVTSFLKSKTGDIRPFLLTKPTPFHIQPEGGKGVFVGFIIPSSHAMECKEEEVSPEFRFKSTDALSHRVLVHHYESFKRGREAALEFKKWQQEYDESDTPLQPPGLRLIKHMEDTRFRKRIKSSLDFIDDFPDIPNDC